MSDAQPTTPTDPIDGDADGNSNLLPHSYDGIREENNPTPGWTLVIFGLSIAFSVAYWVWFHGGGPGQTAAQGYQADLAEHQALRAAASKHERIDERGLADAVSNPAVVARGNAIFVEKCVTCHGPAGAGLVGPNLTDTRQIHGSSRLDVFATVRDGVPAKGMLAWGTMMPQADVVAAAAFVITLRGTNVVGKAAEGEPVSAFEDVK